MSCARHRSLAVSILGLKTHHWMRDMLMTSCPPRLQKGPCYGSAHAFCILIVSWSRHRYSVRSPPHNPSPGPSPAAAFTARGTAGQGSTTLLMKHEKLYPSAWWRQSPDTQAQPPMRARRSTATAWSTSNLLQRRVPCEKGTSCSHMPSICPSYASLPWYLRLLICCSKLLF